MVNPRQNHLHCSTFTSTPVIPIPGWFLPPHHPQLITLTPFPPHNPIPLPINDSPPLLLHLLSFCPVFPLTWSPSSTKSPYLVSWHSTTPQDTLNDLKPPQSTYKDFGAKNPFKRLRSIEQYQGSRLKDWTYEWPPRVQKAIKGRRKTERRITFGTRPQSHLDLD